MIYGDGRFGEEKGAIGWLVGEENKGLACMFTMMNNARLAVGMQGVAIAEAATQKAVAYARDRTQGKAPGWTGAGQIGAMSPIIEHPDVIRMLLTMKALTQGARAIAYSCAHATDMAHRAGDDKKHWQERAALLTPVAKSFATDIGVDVASLGIQVHGGMGFIEETGAARYLRDARIAPIYEGTNGIQAIDLVTRKLPLSDGGEVKSLIAELQQIADRVGASDAENFGATANRLNAAITDLQEATDWLLAQLSAGNLADALAGATPYQRLFGLTLTGCYLAKGALADADDGKAADRIALCRFAAENLLTETTALKDAVVNGAASLAAARSILA
jgi:acyl-CoA dehydrogenase